MSHDLRLVKGKAKKPVAIRVGGIPQYGGTIAYNPETQRVCDVEEVRFNVTYNYGCILALPDVLGEEYWKATPRNVIKTLDHMILVLNVVRTQERSCARMTFDGD